MSPAYPELLDIPPLAEPPTAKVRVPGSKSLTNRALALAALAEPSPFGPACVIDGALQSEDTEIMVECLRRLGIPVAADWPRERLTVPSVPRAAWAAEAELFVGNSGTTMRFLTSLAAMGPGRYRLDGIPRMRERPIADLLDALSQLGVHAVSEQDTGCPPVIVNGGGLPGGAVRLKGDVSSQFLSGLMMVAPLAERDLTIDVQGDLVSVPYVRMTALLMEECGIKITIEADAESPEERGSESPEGAAPGNSPPLQGGAGGVGSPIRRLTIPGRQRYPTRLFTIEPDASAASYFFAAAAITGGEVTVLGHWHPRMQGDLQFLRLLQAMGCTVQTSVEGITVQGGKELRGIDADMNAISDTVMTLAAVACFAQGPTVIHNVGHIRHKESDRLHALAVELARAGAGVEERPDGLVILPRPLHGATLDTYNDHRLAMSLSLLGLRTPGIAVHRPGCVAKTYPRFFTDLALLRPPASR